MASSNETGKEYLDPVPLTRMEIESLMDRSGYPTHQEKFMEVVYRVARIIERAHGITMDERRKTK